jgi:hypothetical protein
MRPLRALILLISVVIAVQALLALRPTFPRNVTASQAESCVVPAEEIKVYAALFRRDGDTKKVEVLVASTEARDYGIDYINLRLAVHGVGLSPEFRSDFNNKNKSSCLIKPSPDLGKLNFISQEGQAAMFVGSRGWTEFHKKYGKDATLYTVSRVGFSADKNLALLHLFAGSGSDAFAGTLFLFENKNGRWQIKMHLQTAVV